jgi:hypothetical protein
MTIFFTHNEAVMLLKRAPKRTPGQPQPETEQAVVRMNLAGANQLPSAQGLDPLPGVSNYYLGNDPSRWRTGVPQYGKLLLSEVYRGVDLLCYGTDRNLEYDFVVAPGADPGQVRLDWDGVDKLALNGDGDLTLRTSVGEIVQKRPRVYQQTAAGRVEVAAKYVIGPNRQVTFALARYNRHQPLIIDPQLIYSTYLGGNSFDYAYAIATDSSSSTYVAGATSSATFPLVSPIKTTNASQDAFVTKFSPAGDTLLYSTYVGGGGNETAYAIAVDSSGATYITGDTSSDNFPVQSPYQSLLGGGFWDAFVVKLTPAGALSYSTYLGGNGLDEGHGIAVDSFGDAFVAGFTASTNFPLQSPIQNKNKGIYNSFVTELSPTGNSLVYSTYLGGSQEDQARALALDSSGSVYVTGTTDSSDFPTVSAFQPTYKFADIFVTKLSPAGTSLEYSTYLGGSGEENAYGIAVDSAGSAYVTGDTASMDFPVVGAYQPNLASNNYDVFITKLAPTGDSLVYSTYFGGTGTDQGYAIAVDNSGAAYVAGWTNSADFPTLKAVQTAQGGDDAFVFKLSEDGATLVYSTYLGGTNNDHAQGIAVAPSGAACVAGWTDSTDFITFMPYQGNQASTDAFVAVIEPELPSGDKAHLISPAPGSTFTGNSVTFTWSSASGAKAYGLGVGTSQANDNIFNQELGLATSQTVSGIPTDGSTIWVRLVTQGIGSIGWTDYQFTAFRNGNKAVMISPASGAVLAGSSVTFSWLIGTGSSSTQLDVGSAAGLGDIFSKNEGLSTSQVVNGIPTDGSTLYVRLTTYIGTLTFFNDYTYQTGSALVPCDIRRDGFLDIIDAQQLISQVLGQVSAANDVNADGRLDVVDLQVVIGALLGRGCLLR